MTPAKTDALSRFTPSRPLILLGYGNMGRALLTGWLKAGLAPGAVRIVDLMFADVAASRPKDICGCSADVPTEITAGAIVLAIKPQIFAQLCTQGPLEIASCADGSTIIMSIMAGTSLATLSGAFAQTTLIIRAMPNTPAAIGQGISGLVAGNGVGGDARVMATALMRAAGEVVWLDDEAQIDALTGVSGSGPAYVFHMIEALAQAGVDAGLPKAISLQLARQTVMGAAALASTPGADGETPDPATLRRNVTSPNGTTQAGLEVLMDQKRGLVPLMRRTVAAAKKRSQDLKG